MSGDRSRVDTVPLIAGSAVLDLVNTVSWRGDPARSRDHLQTPDQCLQWALRAGVLTAAESARLSRDPGALGGLVADLTAFREVVAQVTQIGNGPLDRQALETIVEAHHHGDLVFVEGRRRWLIRRLDEHTVRRRLALQLEWLLTASPGRIGVCADDDCRWVFLDTSRAQNRRWCSSADCGNRQRVRQHQRRAAGTER